MKSLINLFALLVLGQLFVSAQTATVTRNVNLRPDPSTDNRPIVLLKKGTQLTLVEANATDGFYHVKTSAGKQGWAWARNIKGLQETGGTSGGQGPITDTQAANSISPDWVNLIRMTLCMKVARGRARKLAKAEITSQMRARIA